MTKSRSADGPAKLPSVGKPFRFSQASLQKVKVPAGQRLKFSDLNGTGARLDATGPNGRHQGTRKRLSKLYRFDGKARTFVFPTLFPLLSWTETEKRIIEIDYLVSRGIDPAAERKKAKATPAPRVDTFADVVAEFSRAYPERRHKKTGRPLSAKQVADTLRYLKRAAAHWGERDIKSITKREAIEFLTGISAEHRTTANRVHASLTMMFRWAEDREIVDKSPLAGVERVAPEVKRERVLDVHEIRTVWEAAKNLPYPASQLVRMLLITGQRLGETSGMRWRDIIDGVWTIPAADTKAHRTQTVPLSALAQEALRECSPSSSSEYVFAGSRGQPFSSSGAAKSHLDAQIAKLREAQGLPPIEPWVLHTLRHVVATQLSSLAIDRFAIRRVLNHVDAEITGRYDHGDHTKIKRVALDRWAQRLREIVGLPPDNIAKPAPFRAVA